MSKDCFSISATKSPDRLHLINKQHRQSTLWRQIYWFIFIIPPLIYIIYFSVMKISEIKKKIKKSVEKQEFGCFQNYRAAPLLRQILQDTFNPHSWPLLCLTFNPSFPLLCVIQRWQGGASVKLKATDDNQYLSIMGGGVHKTWNRLMALGVYCNPVALCRTTSPSILKYCLYRSLLQVGGLNYFPIPLLLTARVRLSG